MSQRRLLTVVLPLILSLIVAALLIADRRSEPDPVGAAAVPSPGSTTAGTPTPAGAVPGSNSPPSPTTSAPSSTSGSVVREAQVPGPVTVAAAGDIVRDIADSKGTAALVRSINPRLVLALGDNAYESGSASDYRRYDAVWGSFKSKTRPIPGNHEYRTPGAKGYFDYFATQTGRKPYYAYNAGAWRFYALNSEIAMSKGSPQEKWLRADLAARAKGKHVLAYIHKPRYSCSTSHKPELATKPLWQALMSAKARIMLTGHNHAYERFSRMDASGNRTSNGMRQFVVGTGGAKLYPVRDSCTNRRAANDDVRGVLKLVLRNGSYSWEFRAVGGKVVDKGSQTL